MKVTQPARRFVRHKYDGCLSLYGTLRRCLSLYGTSTTAVCRLCNLRLVRRYILLHLFLSFGCLMLQYMSRF